MGTTIAARPEPGDLAWLVAALVDPGFSQNESHFERPAGSSRHGSSARSAAHCVVPGRSRARVLLPRDGRRPAAGSLLAYNELRPPMRRVARALLAAGFRAGVAPRVFPTVALPPGGDGAGDWSDLDHLLRQLEDLAGGGSPRFAYCLGRPGPFRKPLIHVLAPNGRIQLVAKVGWNDLTRSLIARDAEVLERFELRPPRSIRLPRPLGVVRSGHLEALALAPFPPVSRYGRAAEAPAAEAITEIASLDGLREHRLSDSPYLETLRARAAALAATGDEARNRLAEAIEGVGARFADLRLTFGLWHGDLVPWNMGLGTRLLVWDWEHSAPAAPLGFDVLHFHFQVPFVAERRSMEVSARRASAEGVPRLGSFGLPARAREAVHRLYLAEIAVRYEEAVASGAGREPRFQLEAALPLLLEG